MGLSITTDASAHTWAFSSPSFVPALDIGHSNLSNYIRIGMTHDQQSVVISPTNYNCDLYCNFDLRVRVIKSFWDSDRIDLLGPYSKGVAITSYNADACLWLLDYSFGPEQIAKLHALSK